MRFPTRHALILVFGALGLSPAGAQAPAGGGFVTPGSTAATSVKPGATALATPDWGKQLLGRWQTTDLDKETGVSTRTEIEFRSDGSYVTRLTSNRFAEVRQPAGGRYRIEKPDQGGFTLSVQRESRDPEADKAEAVDSQRISAVDADTLKAADGSTVQRLK